MFSVCVPSVASPAFTLGVHVRLGLLFEFFPTNDVTLKMRLVYNSEVLHLRSRIYLCHTHVPNHVLTLGRRAAVPDPLLDGG